MRTILPFHKPDDLFIPLSKRNGQGSYYIRIDKWNKEMEAFLDRLAEELIRAGCIVNDRISNPSGTHLAYFDEILGRDFELSASFIYKQIKKWMPRLPDLVQRELAQAIHEVLLDYEAKGKNRSILFNAYAKFMCSLYYKFESVLLQTQNDTVPKIVYDGAVNEYEIKLLFILAVAGCDVVLIEKAGDAAYLMVDKESRYSCYYPTTGEAFPHEFSMERLRQRAVERKNIPEIRKEAVPKKGNINAWLLGDVWKDSLKLQKERGTDKKFYYNIFAGAWGAEDKNSYYNELLKWKLKSEATGKKVSVIENGITPPDFQEISRIRRGTYRYENEIILDMVKQITVNNSEARKYAANAFSEILLEETGIGVQKFLNSAITLLCWLNKYVPKLIKNGIPEELPMVVYYGCATNKNELLFLRMLSRMPVDVLIVNPDLSEECRMEDKFFFLSRFEESLPREKFPVDTQEVTFGTTAYHAEQDLNTILYQDTGVYRNRQFKKAVPVKLSTTYEEIDILWNQEALYRPNFEVLADRVMLPVICSKVSGVSGDIEAYWNSIAKLTGEDVFVIKGLPYITANTPNPFKDKAFQYYRNGVLLADKMCQSSAYPFAFIREEMQQYMISKLVQLIESRLITGTGSTGTEYAIIYTVLNMDKGLLRMIQKFDFTKNIPKVLVIHTSETSAALEDSILIAYLSMLGFDVAVYVPTGYSSIERFFTGDFIAEHQVGRYIYDLTVPDLERIKRKRESFADKLFRRKV